MSDQKNKKEDGATVTFYVTRADGNIPESGPNVYWPFSGTTQGYTAAERQQLPEDAAKNVRFERGFFTTNNKDQIWLLDHYNSGGTWTDARGGEHFYPGETILNKISREDPYAKKTEIREVEVERIVTKTVFPLAVIQTMDPGQLTQICMSLNIDLSNVDQTVESMTEVLRSKGFIAE